MDHIVTGDLLAGALVRSIYTRLVRRHFMRLESYLDPRIEVRNPKFVSIGRHASLRPYSWLYAICGDTSHECRLAPLIEIGDRCHIGRFCHITASNQVRLENDVLIGECVLITDNLHAHASTILPIHQQGLISRGPVIIRSGTWVGDGARIIGGVTIGCNCVIGANAVVTKDVPDFCVVAGVPGHVIRRFEPTTDRWVRSEPSVDDICNPEG